MPTAVSVPTARPQVAVATVAGVSIAAGVVALAIAVDGRLAALLVVGGLAGLALHHALFGFASSTRRFLVDRRGVGVRAQLLMIAVASVAFVPILAGGSAFGHGLGGALAPVGVSVALGAFIFGIGMQLGGGCASGTLSGAGAGSVRMAITLAAFIAGSVIGTAHLPWWLDQPRLAPISIPNTLGRPAGLAVQLAAIGLLALAALALERRRHGAHEPLAWGGGDWRRRLLHGGWPLAWGALALALLNLATLLIAGHPWSVTWGFALWGASLADALGFGIADWTFWQWPGPARKLAAGVAHDTVSVMNVGLIFGALLGAALAGRFAPRRRLTAGQVASAVIGGLLLGYGARLAFGCNIGAPLQRYRLRQRARLALAARRPPRRGARRAPPPPVRPRSRCGTSRRRSPRMTSTVSTTPDTSLLQRVRKALPRLLLLAAVLAGIVVAVLYRDSIDATALETWITQFGPWAPIVFFCAYVLATVLFLPGLLFTLAAGALFGPYVGTLIALIGAAVGATIAFLIARYVLADWIAARTPARVQRVIEGVEDEGWRFVAMTRLIPFIPFNALNYALGLTRIRLMSYVLASIIFMAPGAAAYAYLGHAGRSLATGDGDLVQNALLGLAVLGLIGFMPRLIKRFMKGRKVAQGETSDAPDAPDTAGEARPGSP